MNRVFEWTVGTLLGHNNALISCSMYVLLALFIVKYGLRWHAACSP